MVRKGLVFCFYKNTLVKTRTFDVKCLKYLYHMLVELGQVYKFIQSKGSNKHWRNFGGRGGGGGGTTTSRNGLAIRMLAAFKFDGNQIAR